MAPVTATPPSVPMPFSTIRRAADNAAFGDAAALNTTGSYNTALGAFAGWTATSGSNNTSLGYYAGYNVTTGSNNVEISNQGTSGDNGVIRIGTAGTQTSTYISGIYGTTTGTNNAVQVLVDSNGNLGTVSSSRRFKEDIQDMGDASSGLLRLRPVTFRYKKPFADGSKPIQYGLIAEEVADVYPDLVVRGIDGQIDTVKYQVLDSMLLSELQKQHATISAQTATIATQKGQIQSLEERLSKIEALVERTALRASAR